MRTEFNKLVEILQDENIYQSYDEVRIALTDLSNKITEVENRIKCVIDTNNDTRQILKAFGYGIIDKGLDEVPIYSDQFEILQRSCNDIDIAIDMNNTECIDNDWYGLFGSPKRNIHTEKPPTELLETMENINKQDFIIWNKVTKEPIENLDIVYHYTTIIEMINDNCLVLGENEELICIAELPLRIQKQINETIGLTKLI